MHPPGHRTGTEQTSVHRCAHEPASHSLRPPARRREKTAGEPSLAHPVGTVAVIFVIAADAGDARPPGCLVTHGALVCSDSAEAIRQELIEWRAVPEIALRGRLERALEAGDLPGGADPAALACFVMTVVNGMAVQAASGAGRDTLHGVVRTALQAWPKA